jgi:hypothetical protein
MVTDTTNPTISLNRAGNRRGMTPTGQAGLTHNPGTIGVNASLPNAFHGATDPYVEIKKERAKHRLMCQMSIAGITNKQIALTMECSEQHVGSVLRQTWAQEFMQNELAAASEDFRERIIAEGQAAFVRICERATDELVPVAIKQKDDHALVDRWLGKAVQPISTNTKNPNEMTLEEIKDELLGGNKRITFDS